MAAYQVNVHTQIYFAPLAQHVPYLCWSLLYGPICEILAVFVLLGVAQEAEG